MLFAEFGILRGAYCTFNSLHTRYSRGVLTLVSSCYWISFFNTCATYCWKLFDGFHESRYSSIEFEVIQMLLARVESGCCGHEEADRGWRSEKVRLGSFVNIED